MPSDRMSGGGPPGCCDRSGAAGLDPASGLGGEVGRDAARLYRTGHPLRKDYVFPREYHGIPASVELDWQHKPDYPGG